MGEVIALHSRRSRDSNGEAARRQQLGKMIRHARGGLTQAELGVLLGVGQPAISAWEAGKVGLTTGLLWSIESTLGLEHGWLSVAGGFVDPSLEPLAVLLEASVTAAKW